MSCEGFTGLLFSAKYCLYLLQVTVKHVKAHCQPKINDTANEKVSYVHGWKW